MANNVRAWSSTMDRSEERTMGDGERRDGGEREGRKMDGGKGARAGHLVSLFAVNLQWRAAAECVRR